MRFTILRSWIPNIAVILGMLHLPASSTSSLDDRCSTIDAAFTLAAGAGTYFLSGEEYILYNVYRESEAKVGPITDLGLAEEVHHFAAAFTLSNGSTAVFIKGCKYFK